MKIKLHTLLLLLLISYAVKAQINRPLNEFHQAELNSVKNEKILELKGAMTFIGNSVIRYDSTEDNSGSNGNGNSYLKYKDIDNDNSTYNSSTAKLELSSCTKIKYVGLYWAGILPYDNSYDGRESVTVAGHNEVVPGYNKIDEPRHRITIKGHWKVDASGNFVLNWFGNKIWVFRKKVWVEATYIWVPESTIWVPEKQEVINVGKGNQTKKWKEVKLKMPNSSGYETIQQDEILFDLNNENFNFPGVDDSEYAKNHYVCYADITERVIANQNNGSANGKYTVANVPVSMKVGAKTGGNGVSGGWNMVVIYEDLINGKPRYFSLFHGHSYIRDGFSQDITIDGFKTIPKNAGTNVPVDVNLIASSLEGDIFYRGDQFAVLKDNKETLHPNSLGATDWSYMSPGNKVPSGNFFNSSLTIDNEYLDNQASMKNSLGIDTHLFKMPNRDNVNIVNSDSKAIFRYSSTGDVYYPYLMFFSVVIKKPVLTIHNTVHTGGSKFGSQNPNANNLSVDNIPQKKLKLGDSFYYDVCFENHSTESANAIKFTSKLPYGVTLTSDASSAGAVRPIYIDGVLNTDNLKFNIEYSNSISFDDSTNDNVDADKVKFLNYIPPTDTQGSIVVFLVGNNLGKKDILAPMCFRLKVKLDDDCNKFTDACGLFGGNQVFANYVGEESGTIVINEGSYPSFDVCKTEKGETKFLIDRDKCLTESDKVVKIYICAGQSTTITAGEGFATYEWFKDDVGGNWQPLTATGNTYPISGSDNSFGNYKVVKKMPNNSDCTNGIELFTVAKFGPQVNPFRDDKYPENKEDGITNCTTNIVRNMSEFYLCGNGKTSSNSKTVELPFGVDVIVTWERLTKDSDTSAIADQNEQCGTDDFNPPPAGWTWKEIPQTDGTFSGPVGGVNDKKFLMKTAGNYRVNVKLTNAICNEYFNFRIFNTKFNIKYNKLDKLCGKPGYIQVIGLDNKYKIRLEKKLGTSSVWEQVFPASAAIQWEDIQGTDNTKSYDIVDKGTYRYQVALKDSNTVACPFTSDEIAIDEKSFVLTPKKGTIACKELAAGPSYSTTMTVGATALTNATYVYHVYEVNHGVTLPVVNITTDPLPALPAGYKSVTGNVSIQEDFIASAGKDYRIVVTATVNSNSVIKQCRAYEDFKYEDVKPLKLTALKKKDITCLVPTDLSSSSAAIVELHGEGGPVSPTYTYEYVLLAADGSEVGAYATALTESVTETNGNIILYNKIAIDPVAYAANKYPLTYRFRLSGNSNYCPSTADVVIGVEDSFKFKVTLENAKCSTANKGKIKIELTSPLSTTQVFQYELVSSSGNNNVAYDTTPVAFPSTGTKEISIAPDTYTVNIKVWKSLIFFNKYKASGYECIYPFKNKIITEPKNVTGGTATPEAVRCDNKKGKITFTKPSTGLAPFNYFVYSDNTTINPFAADTSKPLEFSLDAGTYDCVIIDSNGCKQELLDIVIAVKPSDLKLKPPVVKYDCDGKGVVTVSPHLSTYKYIIKNKLGNKVYPGTSITFDNSIGVFNEVPVGNYTINVTYALGCTVNDISFEVIKGKELTANLVQTKPISCLGANDGEAKLTVTNFDTTTGFWYEDTNAAVVTPKVYGFSLTSPVTLTGLSKKTDYKVYYKNPSLAANASTQCDATVAVTIASPDKLLTIAPIVVPKLACQVGSVVPVGVITPVATDGNKPYSFEIALASPTPTATSWEAMVAGKSSFSKPTGTYIVRVKDASGCTKKSTTFTIESSAAPDFTISEVNDCDNRYGKDADVKVTLPTGTTPSVSGYEYQISTVVTATTSGWKDLSTFTLTGGTYTSEITTGSVVNTTALPKNYVKIRAKGSNTCYGTQSIIIKDILSFSATATPAGACTTKDAVLTISSEKGGYKPTSNYEFAVVKSGQPKPTAYISLASTKKISVLATDIPVGGSQSFDVYMKDANGCTTKRTISINRPVAITAVIEAKYTLCSTTANPKIIVKVTGGNPPYTINAYDTQDTSTIYKTYKTTDPSNDTPAIVALLDHEYYIKIIDNDGCVKQSNTINFKNSGALNAKITSTDQPVCSADAAVITIKKPTNPSVLAQSNGGNYIYTLKSTDKTITETTTADPIKLTVPDDGTYVLTVSEVSTSSTSGCPQVFAPITIKALVVTLPTFTKGVTYACDGTASIQVSLAATSTALPAGVKLTYILDGDFTKKNETGKFDVASGSNSYVITVVYARDGQTITGPLSTINARTPCTVPLTVDTVKTLFTVTGPKTTDVKCRDTNTGTATFKVENFGTKFYYKYVNAAGVTIKKYSTTGSVTISELPKGTTDIHVYPTSAYLDSGDCYEKLSAVIKEPIALGITVAVKPMQCGTPPTNAIITPTGVNGWGSYTYVISEDYVPTTGIGTWSAATTTSFSKKANDYYIKVIDKNGCEKISDKIEIRTPKRLFLEVNNIGAKCARYGIDGDIQLILRNGERGDDYEFKIGNSAPINFNFPSTGPMTFDIVEGTVVGVNPIKVRNKNTDCVWTGTITIKDDLVFEIDPIAPTSCDPGNFKLESIKGGEAPYNYVVLDSPSTEPTPVSMTVVLPATGVLFKAATVGFPVIANKTKIFDIWVKDKNGCIKKVSKTLSKPAALVVTVVPKQKVCSDDKAELKITVTGGNSGYKAEVFDKTNTTTPVFTTAILPGFTDFIITDPKIKVDVEAGKTFYVVVTDKNGCKKQSTDQVMVYGANALATKVVTQPICTSDKGVITMTNPVVTGLNSATGPFEYTLTLLTTTSGVATGTVTTKNTVAGDLTTKIDVTVFGTYKLSVKDLGVTGSSGCPQVFPNFKIEALISKPEFKIGKLDYLCDGTADIKIVPVPGANYDTAIAAGVTFHYGLRKDPNNVTTPYIETNEDGNFNVPSLTKKYIFDIIYVKAGVIFDVANLSDYPCANLSAVEVDVVADKEFKAVFKKSIPLVCKGDSDSGIVVFDVSNFNVNNTTPAGDYYYKKGIAAAVSSTDAVLTVGGLPKGETIFVFAPTMADFTNGKGCTIEIKVNITEPTNALDFDKIDISNIKCTTGGFSLATITPIAKGGTPGTGYKYYISNSATSGFGIVSANKFEKPVGTIDYYIKVVDGAGCEKVSPAFKITGPKEPLFELSEVACGTEKYGVNADVIITNISTVLNTTTEYQYEIAGSGTWHTFKYDASNEFLIENGLNVGTSNIVVRNKITLCSLDKDITIKPVLNLTLENDIPSSCDVGGFIVKTKTGGHPGASPASDYTFAVVKSVLPNTTAPTTGFVNLIAGDKIKIPTPLVHGASETYVVWMKDSKGCTTVSSPIKLTRDKKLEVKFVTNQPECDGLKGKLVYTVTGGKSKYSVQLFKDGVAKGVAVVSTTGLDISFDVDPGEYTVMVTDFRTCTKTSLKETIVNGKSLDGSVKTLTQPTCLIKTGSVLFDAPTVAIGNSTPDYLYTLEAVPTAGSTTPGATIYTSSTVTITGVAPGKYIPVIRDSSISNGCPQKFAAIEILPVPNKSLTFKKEITYDCNGKPTLKITPDAGSAPSDFNASYGIVEYTYVVKGDTTGTNISQVSSATGVASISSLPIGDFNYTVDVKYGTGCLLSKAFTVDIDLNKFEVSKIERKAVTCYNYKDGKLIITVANPNPNSTATTTTPNPSPSVIGFYYRVSPSTAWIAQTGSVLELSNLSPILNSVEISYDNLTTLGSCPISISETIPNVPQLKITDVKINKQLGCTDSGIFSPAEINVISQGTLTSKSYTYAVLKLVSGVYQDVAPFAANSSLPIYIDEKGTYKIQIKDDSADQCAAVSSPFTLADPVKIDFTLTADCYTEGVQASITINTINSVGPIALSNPKFQFITDTGVVNVEPTKINNTTWRIAGLQPGKYTVKVNDNTNCATTKEITIGNIITFRAEPIDASCNDATITVLDVLGGNSTIGYEYAVIGAGTILNPAIHFQIGFIDTSGNPFGKFTVPNIEIPNIGDKASYDIYVRSNGCISDKITKEVKRIKDVAVSLKGVNQPTCLDEGSISIDINGGLENYSVQLFDVNDPSVPNLLKTKAVNGTPASSSNAASGATSFLGLVGGNYKVVVTDATNCTSDVSVTLKSPPPMPDKLVVQTPKNINCTKFDFLSPAEQNQYIIGVYMDDAYPPTAPNTTSPSIYDGYSFEISIDYGAIWTSGYEVIGVRPDTPYDVIIRMKETSTGKIVCRKELGKGKMPTNVIGLVFKANFAGDCKVGFTASLEVEEGTGPFEFSKDDGLTWVPADLPETIALVPPSIYNRVHIFEELTLGQEYKFVVKDTYNGCEKDNAAKPLYNIPVDITAVSKKNICASDGPTATTGEMTFKVNNTPPPIILPVVGGNIDNTASDVAFTWTLYKRSDVPPFGLGQSTGFSDNAVLPMGVAEITLPTITGLSQGTYFLKIKVGDASNPDGCEYASQDVKIELNTEIIAKLEKIRDVTCNTDGLVRIVNVSGGNGPYTYAIIAGNNIITPTTLSANGLDVLIPKSAVIVGKTTAEIFVIATDSNGCKSRNVDNDVTVNVADNPKIKIISSESCSIANKTITVEVTNQGNSLADYTYQYSLDGTSWVSETVVNASHTISGISTSGVYKVRVKDGSGCYSNIVDVTLVDPVDFSLLNVDKSCEVNENKITIGSFKGSGLYSWKVVSGVGGGVPTPLKGIVDNRLSVDVVSVSLLVNKNSSYGILLKDSVSNCTKTISIQTGEAIKPVFTVNESAPYCYDDTYKVTMTDPLSNPLDYSIIVGSPTSTSSIASYMKNVGGKGYVFSTMDNTKPVEQKFIIRGTSTVNACFTDVEVTVKIPAKIKIDDIVPVPFKCATVTSTANNASISMALSNISGGTGSYEVAKLFKHTSTDEFINSEGSSGVTLTAPVTFELNDFYADGGDFFVRVYDDKGCSADSNIFTINKFDALKSLGYAVVKEANCLGIEKIKINYESITNDPSKVEITLGDNSGAVSIINSPYVVDLDKTKGPYKINIRHKITGCVLPEVIHAFTDAPKVIITPVASPVSCKELSPGGLPGNDGSVVVTVDNYTETEDFKYEIFKTGGASIESGETNTTFTVSGLKAGNYTIELTLSKLNSAYPACKETQTFKIDEPNSGLLLTSTPTSITCKDSNDGKLNYNAINGWGAPYTYKVEMVNGSPTGTPPVATPFVLNVLTPVSSPGTVGGFGTDVSLSNLSPGFYRITAKDNSNCDSVLKYVEITEPTDVTGTIDPFTCSGGTVTEVTVKATVGTSLTAPATGFTYVLYKTSDLVNPIKEQTSNVFLISDKGEYSIKVKDNNGCISSDYMKYNGSNTFTIKEKLVVDLAKETQIITCSNDGIATVDIKTGSGDYSYTVTNIQDATYSVSGAVIAGSGVDGAASFTFDTKVISTTTTGIGSKYTVVVTDKVSTCVDTKVFEVAPAITPIFNVTEILSVCSSREYKVRLSSDTNLDYSVKLNSGSQFTGVIDSSTSILTITKTSVITQVKEDVTIIATDPVTGCSKEEILKDVELLENLIKPITIDAKQFECTLNTNTKNVASIKLISTPSGGAGAPYKAELWKVDGSSENRIDIKPATNATEFIVNNSGTYYIKMFDSTDICSVESLPVVIAPFEELPKLYVRPVAGSRSCTPDTENIILEWIKETPTSPIKVTITAAGSSTPLQTVTTPSTAEITLNKAGAPYTIVITNTVTGCKQVYPYKLSNKPTPKVYVTPTNVTCKGTNTGKVVFNFVDSYTGNYTFEVTGTLPVPDLVNSDNEIDNLPAGSYTALVKMADFPNCNISVAFTITESNNPINLTTTPTNLSCNGTVDGKLSFSSTGGWGDYKYTVQKVVDNTTIPSSIVSTIQTNSAETELLYLDYGFYKVIVTDKYGCDTSKIVEIENPDLITVDYAITKSDCSLIDTTVGFSNTLGGTPASVSGNDVYTYSIYKQDGTLYAGPQVGAKNTVSFNINDSGKYYGKVRDSKNCPKVLDTITVYEPLKFELLQETEATTCDAPGKVRFKVSGGKGIYTYSVTGNGGTGTLASTAITMVTPNEGTFETDIAFDNQEYNITVSDAGVMATGGTVPCSIDKSITIGNWSKPKFDVVSTKPLCASDHYILTPSNSNLVYTAVSTSASPTVDITMVAGVIYVKKNITGAVLTETVRVSGSFSSGSACPSTEDVIVTFDANINEPVITATQFNCTTGTNNSNLATIDVSFTAGVNAPYIAELWKAGGVSAILSKEYPLATPFEVSDYTGGDYVVKIFDNTNVCAATSAPVTINPFVELELPTIKVLPNTISCKGEEDVEITWLKTTGVQLQILPVTGTVLNYPGGAVDTYTTTSIKLKENDKIILKNTISGCEWTKVYKPSATPNYQIRVTEKDICYGGGSTGEATFSFVGNPTYDISNTANTYTYQVFTASGTPMGTVSPTDATTVTGLAKGNYKAVVTMTAFPDCEVTKLFTIDEPQPLVFLKAKANSVSCNNGTNGSIEFVADGGWGSYTYEVTPLVTNTPLSSTTTPSYNGTDTFISGLVVGKYIVIAKDKNGCTVTKTLTIENPSIIEADDLTIVDNCSIAIGAKVTVPNARGGFVTGGSTTYKYVLYKESDGSIYAGPKASNEFDITESGTYQIEVFNAKGCSSGFIKFNGLNKFTINDKLKFHILETKSVTCKANGEVTINVTSGSGIAPSLANYTIEVKEPITVANPTPTFVGITGNTFDTDFNNNGKVYTVKITDNNSNSGCSLELPITVSNPAKPQFTASEIISTCFSSSYIAVFSDPNLVYTTTDVTNTTSIVTITNNEIEVSSLDDNILNRVITVKGTDPTTGCSIDKILTIVIPAKLDFDPIAVTPFNCAVTTPANNTLEPAKVTLKLNSVIPSGLIASLYKGTVVGSGILLDSQNVTVANISFDVVDNTGGDYYISLSSGSCVTSTGVTNIAAFLPLDAYTLTVVADTNCAGEETIRITPAQIGVTISVKDKSGVTLVPVAATTGDFIIKDNAAPYSITLANGGSCELIGSYSPGPKKIYVLDKEITHAYCTSTGSVEFNFASYTDYNGEFSYEIKDITGTTSIVSPVTVPVVTGTHAKQTVSNLNPGKYQLVVTLNPIGCVFSSPFEIVTPAQPLNFTPELNAISCNNPFASMTINTIGGGIPYKYEVTTTGGVAVYEGYDNYIQDLVKGDYSIKVIDIYGCSVTKLLTIDEPTPIIVNPSVVSDNVCYGLETASITVGTAIGGIQNNVNYSYILEYPNGVRTAAQVSNVFAGLEASPIGKPYNVYVVGDGGCLSAATSVDIVDPTQGEITATVVKTASCVTKNAKIKVIATSNVPIKNIYKVAPDGSVTSEVGDTHVFDLAPNDEGESYTFYAEDNKGCFTDIMKYSVSKVIPLTATVDVIKEYVTCFGSNDGIALVKANGGEGIRTYTLLDKSGTIIVPAQASSQFLDLAAGEYKVNVNSGVDCVTTTKSFTIIGPDKLEIDTLTYTSEICTGDNDGTIVVTAKGGWNDNGKGYKYTISTDAPGRVRNSGDFKNLAPGDYIVTVFDMNGSCPISSSIITIEPADVIVGTVQNVIQRACSSDTSLPSFEVKLSGGTAPYFIDLHGTGIFKEVPDNGTDNANGTIAKFGENEGIVAGKTYIMFVKDSRNCSPERLEPIKFVETLDLGLEVKTVYDCDTTGTSEIIATVNSIYANDVNYTLWINDDLGGIIDMETNNTGIFSNHLPGKYYVTAKQVTPGTCEEKSTEFELKEVTALLTFTVDQSEMNTLIVIAEGGLAPYEYSFDGGITFTSDNTLKYSETTDYDIVVKDSGSCSTGNIITGKFDSIIIPNYFTPDGDGVNDFWYPKNVRMYHNLSISIFDRYSREIEVFKGLSKGWNGLYNGKPLPRGDYWYRIRYTELSGSIIDKVGNFTLYRRD